MNRAPRGGGFGFLARLAWRNLGRQRRRTALLVVVVAYATMAIIFFWGFTDGFLVSIFQGQVRYLSAPVLLTTESYHRDPDPEHALPELGPVLEAARGEDAVEAATPRLEVPGLLRSPYASVGSELRGIDPNLERAVSDLHTVVGEGRWLQGTGEIVLGQGVAERLDVRVGERLAVDVSSVAGPQATGLVLVGLLESGITAVDDATALVHIDDARALTGVETATGVALAVPFGREARVASALQPALSGEVRAYGVEELMGQLAEGLATERASMIPIGLLFSLFAAIAVTSSVVVSVMERTREFGVMIALGLDQPRLAWLVTLEAILATLLGFVVGALLGYGLNLWLASVNVLGPLFTNLYGNFLSGLAIGDEIYADMRAEYLIYAGITVALAAVFAALTPARRVRRLEPTEAMRHAD